MRAPGWFAAGTALLLAAPALAQAMDHAMPGMKMPAPAASQKAKRAVRPRADAKAAAKPANRRAPAASEVQRCAPEHAMMGHCTPKSDETKAPAADPVAAAADPNCAPEHAAMGHCKPTALPAAAADPACPPEHATMGHCKPGARLVEAADAATVQRGTALAAGDAPAPAAPEPTYADRIWGHGAMAPARDALRKEHGGMPLGQVMFNLAEVQVRDGRDGYRWDGEAWYGGDIHRLTIKSEGEGTFRETAEGEVQALYSRAVGPYFNLQAGIRQDFAPGPNRTYATVGFEGLAPYWFDVEGAVFLSNKGDVLGRLEGYYDQRITQRLILQPRAELNLSAQEVPGSGLGSGVTDAELGLRLRYELVREFAPYVGVSWERKFGDTARFARASGEGAGGFSLVAGVRTWF